MVSRSWMFILISAVCISVVRPADAQELPRFPSLPLDTPNRPPPATSFQLPLPPPSLPPVTGVFEPQPEPSPRVEVPKPNSDSAILPQGAKVTIPNGGKPQLIRLTPRYGKPGKGDFEPVGDGTDRLVYTGGLIVNVTYEEKKGEDTIPYEYEFAADNIVMWIRGTSGRNLLSGQPLETKTEQEREIEIYMFGNVVIRSREVKYDPKTNRVSVNSQTVRADQIYYDVNNNRAIAVQADLELTSNFLPEALHLYSDRLTRLSRGEWYAQRGGAFSSKLPSDPGIEVLAKDISYIERETVPRNFLGIPYRKFPSGELDYTSERVLTGRHSRVELLGVPIFYSPSFKTDPAEPLGPLQGIGFGSDTIFGAQIFTTWDMYKLIAFRPPEGHKWRLNLDYLGDRGPGYGSDYDYTNPDFFGFGGKNTGTVKLYGVNDGGIDNLGGFRGNEPIQSRDREGRRLFRGRALWRNQTELFVDRDRDSHVTAGPFVTLQNQFAYQSDKNFYEQYFKQEFDSTPNNETFNTLTGSYGRLHGSLLVQSGLRRNWVNDVRFLPKASASLLGQSFFDRFTYNTRVEGAYAEFRPADVEPLPLFSTEKSSIKTGRADWWQELSLPLSAGPLHVVPYGILDLTAYGNDLNGDSRGRVYGGGGARTALTVSRIYSDVSNEIFNLKGLNHKATLRSNYLYSRSSVSHKEFAQIDRLNDEALDLSIRSITPLQDLFAQDPASVLALQSAPFYNPQRLAIRRLVDNVVDTRDGLQVVQLGLDQRLQTKRGYPGREHTVDWLSFDVSTSLFPEAERDNFGKTAAFMEYNTLWNIGDQTSINSNGWFDPFESGARFWNVGVNYTRPDKSSFYFGYRQTDPVNSKAVIAAVGYQLTRKYSVSGSAVYDFGTRFAVSNTLVVSRTGTDLTFTVGVTYNQLVNNFGFTFAIVPNIASLSGLGRIGTPFIQR